MQLRERRVWSDIAAGGAAMALAFVLAAIALHLWNADFHYPFDYGGDANLNQIAIKDMLEHGWYQHNPSLAAPFGQTMLDFPVFSGDTLQFLIMKVIGLFTGDAAAVMNVFYVLCFPLAAFTAFLTLRLLGIGRLAAVTAAVLYAIAPYHFLRGEFHLFIGAYYAVPLGLFLALTVMQGNAMPRLRWLLPLCVVIGSAHVYYAVFTLLLLAAALVVRLVAHDGWRALVPSVLPVALITLVVVANHLPNIIYAHQHGSNPAITRLPSESERFGLRLVEMVLPVPGHRIDALADLRERYKPAIDPVNEGDPQAIGILATLGLVWLAGVGLLGGTPRLRRHADALQVAAARLLAIAFVAGTAGGVSALVTYFVTDQVRAWGRISIVIAFLCLIPIAVLVDRGVRAWRLRTALVLAAGLLLFGFLDQTNHYSAPDYAGNRADYQADRDLVRAVEAKLPVGASIFNLPLEPFPEPQPAYTIATVGPYILGRPYLHSRHLRWSYGAMKGRADGWQEAAVSLPPALLARALAASGFAGVMVDRGAYNDAGDRVIAALQTATGAAPQFAPNKRLVFFDLRAYSGRLLAGRSAAARARLRHDVLSPVRIGFSSAFSAPRQSDDAIWRYLGQDPGIVTLSNPDAVTRNVQLGLTLAAPPDRRTTARIVAPGRPPRSIGLAAGRRRVTLRLALPPGTSQVVVQGIGDTQSLLPDVGLPYDLLVQDAVVADDALVKLGPAGQSPLSSNAGSPFFS